MAIELTTITSEEFLTATGIDLGVELLGKDDDIKKVDIAIQEWTLRVYEQIRVSKSLEQLQNSLTPNQIATIKRAIINYGQYYLQSGDLYLESGVNVETGTIMPQNELEKARFPQHIKDNLRRNGLIQRNGNYLMLDAVYFTYGANNNPTKVIYEDRE